MPIYPVLGIATLVLLVVVILADPPGPAGRRRRRSLGPDPGLPAAS